MRCQALFYFFFILFTGAQLCITKIIILRGKLFFSNIGCSKLYTVIRFQIPNGDFLMHIE